MGLSIGSNVGSLRSTSGTETYPRVGWLREQDRQRQPDSKYSSPFFPEDTTEPDKVGFGAGTVSVPGVAVKAIGYSREGATQIVETLQEAQSRIRERRAELDEGKPAKEATPPPPTFDFRSVGVGAAEGARTFINGLNEAAGRAQSRIEGTPPPSNQPQLNIRVGDETIPFTRQTQQPTLDVFA